MVGAARLLLFLDLRLNPRVGVALLLLERPRARKDDARITAKKSDFLFYSLLLKIINPLAYSMIRHGKRCVLPAIFGGMMLVS